LAGVTDCVQSLLRKVPDIDHVPPVNAGAVETIEYEQSEVPQSD
jgi:hypothetical protein